MCRRPARFSRTKALVALAAALLSGCSSRKTIIVGSKNFTEQIVLGEILAQQIERRLHTKVERKLDLNGTLLTHAAITAGSIDLYPEYSGTAFAAVLKQDSPSDRAQAFKVLNGEYSRRWQLNWLAPFGFNDSFAMVVRGDMARSEKITSLSEAARHPGWKLGAGYEFTQRKDGLDGLLKTYNLQLENRPVIVDLGLLYKALESKTVDIVAGNGTDGLLSARDFTVLRDDKHYFPPYDCAVVVRQETLQRVPEVRTVLNELAGSINDETMRRLNYQVDGEHRSPKDVAASFLRTLTAGRQ